MNIITFITAKWWCIQHKNKRRLYIRYSVFARDKPLSGWMAQCHGPLAIYVKLRTAHAPPRVSDHDMHHGTCVTHVPWCMPESLTSDFRCSRWRGKRSRHSRRMRNQQFYVSGKRPMTNEIEDCPCPGTFLSLWSVRITLKSWEGFYFHAAW